MTTLKQLSELKLVSIKHVNHPRVGDKHETDDCPGGGPWPCNRPGKNVLARVEILLGRG